MKHTEKTPSNYAEKIFTHEDLQNFQENQDDTLFDLLFLCRDSNGTRIDTSTYREAIAMTMSALNKTGATDHMEVYYRNNIGNILSKLYSYFNILEKCDADKYVDWLRVNKYSGSLR